MSKALSVEESLRHVVSVDDHISGTAGDDTLSGTEGDDQIWGFDGNDVLSGGGGNDLLYGGIGNDTFLFDIGFGVDTIEDDSYSMGSHQNRIVLGDGLTADNLTLHRDVGDLVISIDGTPDSIVVRSHFGAYTVFGGHRISAISSIEFADGTTWGLADIVAHLEVVGEADTLYGTDGNDVISGLNGDDLVSGEAGNDVLYGNRGNDFLYGYKGQDTLNGGIGDDFLNGDNGSDRLFGGAGDDHFNSGRGNDVMDGGAGNDRMWVMGGADTYMFGIGSGRDTIAEGIPFGSTDGSRILLGEGIDTSDISMKLVDWDPMEGWELRIAITGTGNAITVEWGWVSMFQWAVAKLEFADGTVWDLNEMMPPETETSSLSAIGVNGNANGADVFG